MYCIEIMPNYSDKHIIITAMFEFCSLVKNMDMWQQQQSLLVK